MVKIGRRLVPNPMADSKGSFQMHHFETGLRCQPTQIRIKILFIYTKSKLGQIITIVVASNDTKVGISSQTV